MSEVKELTFDIVIEDLNRGLAQLDNFAQAATKDSEDPVLRGRLTQALVLAGTSVEILAGLNSQAKAAKAAMDATEESKTEENNG